jgi:hypothetical protein
MANTNHSGARLEDVRKLEEVGAGLEGLMIPSLKCHAKGVYTIMVVLFARCNKATRGSLTPQIGCQRVVVCLGIQEPRVLSFRSCISGRHSILYFPIISKAGFVTPVSLQVTPSIGSPA